jgi:hypothetical protein
MEIRARGDEMTLEIASREGVIFSVNVQPKSGVPSGRMDKRGNFVTDWGERRENVGVLLPKAGKRG